MIYLGSDHGGFELKENIKKWLTEWGYKYEDCGAYEFDPEDDYPDFATKVAKQIQNPKSEIRNKFQIPNLNDQNHADRKGIVICRNGIGVSIVANKFKGVRCALGFDSKQVKFARLDDDANVLALPADYLTNDAAKSIVKTFLKTEFSGEEKHVRRLRKIKKIEGRY